MSTESIAAVAHEKWVAEAMRLADEYATSAAETAGVDSEGFAYMTSSLACSEARAALEKFLKGETP